MVTASAFVNRGDELATLVGWLGDRNEGRPAALVFIRSPTGFGKSGLTDRLVEEALASADVFCIVDPEVRGRIDGARLHEGYFLQRCAEALSQAAQAGRGHWRPLPVFLRERRWRTAAEKKLLDAVQELPTAANLYRVAFGYLSRALGWGAFAAERLIASDEAAAVALCEEYVASILSMHRAVLIVREAQHIDLRSLRALLQLNAGRAGVDMVFEYTTDRQALEPHHERVFDKTADRSNFHILQLEKLDARHLESLVRELVGEAGSVEIESHLAWSGNLNEILEFRHVVQLSRPGGAEPVRGLLGDLRTLIGERVGALPGIEKLVLVLALANVEPVARWTLERVVAAIHPEASAAVTGAAIEALAGRHVLLAATGSSFRLSNETVAETVRGSRDLVPLVGIAEAALRDHYAGLVGAGAYGPVGLPTAVRQLFRLCASTRDVAGLLRATRTLSQEVARSQDQAMYVGIVREAVEADDGAMSDDRDVLLDWAAALAYEAGEWSGCVSLLSSKASTSPFDLAMRACALQEVGRHDEALGLAGRLRDEGGHAVDRLAAALIQAAVIGCLGEGEQAATRLHAIIATGEWRDDPLLGYAHRFFEIVADYAVCRDRLASSVAILEEAGLVKAAAYSSVALAVYHARFGDLDGARASLEAAARGLEGDVHARHVVLNNAAAVDLLASVPDYEGCCAGLNAAMRHSRDDYSDLTIVANMAIAYEGSGDLARSFDCLERAFAIMDDHDFADRDVYWPVCFNAAAIWRANGRPGKADAALAFPSRHGRAASVNKAYWAYRYDGAPRPAEPAHLCARSRHPLYLSQWLIDREGLERLRRAPLR